MSWVTQIAQLERVQSAKKRSVRIKYAIGKTMEKTVFKALKLNNTEVLKRELMDLFPDNLPRTELTPFQLGILVGQQQVIDKIRELLEE